MALISTILIPGQNPDIAELRDWLKAPTFESIATGTGFNAVDSTPHYSLYAYGTGHGVFRAFAAGGTEGAPSAILNGREIGAIGWWGYGATGWADHSAAITAGATEDWTDTKQGCAIAIWTTKTGTISNPSMFNVCLFDGAGLTSLYGGLHVEGDKITTLNKNIESGKSLRATGYDPPSTGRGVEVAEDGSKGLIYSIERGVDWTDLQIGAAKIILAPTGNEVKPSSGDAVSLGTASNDWANIYTLNAVTVTSDERLKRFVDAPEGGVAPVAEAELRAARRILAEIGPYQWLASLKAAEEKGGEARVHWGPRAQAVWRILIEEGLEDAPDEGEPLTSSRNAFLCYDRWEDEYEPVMAHIRVKRMRTVRRASPVLGADGKAVIVTAEEPFFEREWRPTKRRRLVLAAGDRYGLRPDGLMMFLWRCQSAENERLRARLAAIEARFEQPRRRAA